MTTVLPVPPLLLIADTEACTGDYFETVSAALDGGCRWVMVRARNADTAALCRLSGAVARLARRHGAEVSVSGDCAACVESGASGVHLRRGQSVADARRLAGPDVRVGVSAHSTEAAAAAVRAGADYVTVSPVFLTPSKPGYGPTLGLEGLSRVASWVPGPVVALAGIGPDNATAALAAGAAGVAVMGGIMAAEAPGPATARIVEVLAGTVGVAAGR